MSFCLHSQINHNQHETKHTLNGRTNPKWGYQSIFSTLDSPFSYIIGAFALCYYTHTHTNTDREKAYHVRMIILCENVNDQSQPLD